MGKEATNDNSEIPFGSLTSQLETFSKIGINYSSALSLARYNNNFYRNEVELCKRHKNNKTTAPIGEQGNLFNLDFPISKSFFKTALQLSTGFREAGAMLLKLKVRKKEKNTS